MCARVYQLIPAWKSRQSISLETQTENLHGRVVEATVEVKGRFRSHTSHGRMDRRTKISVHIIQAISQDTRAQASAIDLQVTKENATFIIKNC